MGLDQTTLHLTANFQIYIVVIAIVLAGAFSAWTYYRTLPPSPLVKRIVLWFLRTSAISCGIILLAQPALEVNRQRTKPARIDILVDQSASMSITQGDVDRVAALKTLSASDGIGKLAVDYRLRYYSFADSILAENRSWDELLSKPPEGVGTNISRAWMESAEKNSLAPPQAYLIISDGANNSGSDPSRMAQRLKMPIYTIGIGSDKPFRDLMVLQALSNRTVYQGSIVPVEVKYRILGCKGESVSVSISGSDGVVIDRQTIVVSSDFIDGEAEFDIPIEKSGRQRFKAQISTLEGEISTANNSRSFFLDVLGRRMRVLLIAGLPDNSLGDLVRRLSDDDRIELIQRTSNKRGFYEGGYPNQDELKDVDVVLFHHFPTAYTNSVKFDAFVNDLNALELPVGFFDGADIAVRKFGDLSGILPVKPNPRRPKLAWGKVVPLQRHAIITPTEEVETVSNWGTLPPLRFSPGKYEVSPDAVAVAGFQFADGRGSTPAIVISERGGRKSLAVMAQDLWRWGLDKPGDEGEIEPLLQRMMRWLAVRKTGKQVEIQFEKEIYSNHETVRFTAFVQNENYEPLDGAVVGAEIIQDGKVGSQITMEGQGGGRYVASFQPWREGDYNIHVVADVNQQRIGERTAKVAVEAFNIELLDAVYNRGLLQMISDVSGGAFVDFTAADSMLGAINLPAIETSESQKYETRGKWWLLAVIIGLLSVEWFIRLRSGML